LEIVVKYCQEKDLYEIDKTLYLITANNTIPQSGSIIIAVDFGFDGEGFLGSSIITSSSSKIVSGTYRTRSTKELTLRCNFSIKRKKLVKISPLMNGEMEMHWKNAETIASSLRGPADFSINVPPYEYSVHKELMTVGNR
jgi:hypothetical protein